ncbi:type IV pilus biogenesis protein PilP [Telmatospirillum sp.]|uniref:type IV pilus biogenesis protein PilP n=1 Tax=Telmatospirillum sp. TaxID=2079197 RepID=UPI00284B0E2A|nr:type IV pilus biogenesis protein PilP [Telmatospirillum sp.]MDR3438184.1 type IV pilus biogenesis protein PilP [Telmatospirillum sp.]
MSSDSKKNKVFALIVVMASTVAAASQAQVPDGAVSAVGPVRTVGVPAPQPVGGPSEAAAVDVTPPPAILREIGQRQTELAILELDLKRAELQKKMRDLEAPPVSVPQFAAGTAAAAGPVPGAVAPAAPADFESVAAPVVQRIHKVGGSLHAVVLLPGGETKDLHKGAVIMPGLRVVEVLPDHVLVRQGDKQPYRLSAEGSRRQGQGS